MRVSLGSLEPEVLSMIFEYVDDESPHTTTSLAKVNKYFAAISAFIGHRRKRIDFHNDTPETVKQWVHSSEILSALRHLEISAEVDQSLSFVHNLPEAIAELISRLGNLKSLNWNVAKALPLCILEALHKYQPKAQLKIGNFTRESWTLDANDPAELALTTSPALVSIRASIWTTGGHHQGLDLREAAFRRIVSSAPNLRAASVVKGHSPCVIHSLTMEEREDFIRLSQEFETNKPNDSLRTLTLDGYGMSKWTLDEWGRYVDLSKLDSLQCSRGYPDISYFKAAPKIFNLKHVSLNLAYNRDKDFAAAVENFISTCGSLETLSLWSWHDILHLSTILSRHGSTLKTLQLHERESDAVGYKRDLLGIKGVREIRKKCPHLRDFTFDLDRYDESLDMDKESENVKVYEELSLFSPRLERVQIYFDLGLAHHNNDHWNGRSLRHVGLSSPSNEDDSQEEEDEDEVDEEEADEISSYGVPQSSHDAIKKHLEQTWKIIFGKRTFGLRHLDAKVGEWERKVGPSYSAQWLQWEKAEKSLWNARAAERDDQVGECVVKLVASGGGAGKLI